MKKYRFTIAGLAILCGLLLKGSGELSPGIQEAEREIKHRILNLPSPKWSHEYSRQQQREALAEVEIEQRAKQREKEIEAARKSRWLMRRLVQPDRLEKSEIPVLVAAKVTADYEVNKTSYGAVLNAMTEAMTVSMLNSHFQQASLLGKVMQKSAVSKNESDRWLKEPVKYAGELRFLMIDILDVESGRRRSYSLVRELYSAMKKLWKNAPHIIKLEQRISEMPLYYEPKPNLWGRFVDWLWNRQSR